jgi:hypothetical protein
MKDVLYIPRQRVQAERNGLILRDLDRLGLNALDCDPGGNPQPGGGRRAVRRNPFLPGEHDAVLR